MSAPRPRAYSYIRFSTPEQAEGDSLRRQVEAAQRWADHPPREVYEKTGFESVELADLTFRDLGRSAFRGKNATEGALAAFVEAIEAGHVKAGDFLLVESLDRLSRDKVRKARDRFEAILDLGVNIATLQDGRIYWADAYDLTDMIISLLVMSRAHEESATKSKRVTAAWRQKQKQAAESRKIVTSKAPAWLRVESDKFVEVADRVEVVRRIFDMSAKGHGHGYICRELNAAGVPTFGGGDGWHRGIVSKILKNKAVLGIYEPMKWVHRPDGRRERVEAGEPVEDYYPRIISPEVFYSIKHAPMIPSGKKGKRPPNLLRGLAHCAQCGRRLHLKNNGYKNGGLYLLCDGRTRYKDCKAPAVKYPEAVAEVLVIARNLRPFETGEAAKRDRKLAALAAEIAEAEVAVERLLDTLERVKSDRAEARLAGVEARLEALQAEETALKEKAIASNGNGRPMFQVFAEVEGSDIWSRDTSAEGADDMLAHVGRELRRLVERVNLKGRPVEVEVVAREGVELAGKGEAPEGQVLTEKGAKGRVRRKLIIPD